MANPTLLKTPIASGGDKNTIPETTGSTTGLLSQEKGWQQINSLPINAGGIAPSRLDFNGVFNLLSNILFYTQKGWQWEFDETQNYFAGCTVKDTADGKTYVCIADVNASTTHPSSDTTHWKLSDLATKDDLANYLPLAGGAMTGNNIKRNFDNSALSLTGATSQSNGAWVELFGKDASGHENKFLIQAGPNSSSRLTGAPDGTLTWGGANVLTDANGGYLPLSGGAMTGQTVNRNVNNSRITIYGGTSFGSGHVTMNGGAYTTDAGAVEIVGATGMDSWASLGIYPQGTIRIGIRGSSLTLCDLGGSAIVAKSLATTGYYKRADGLIEQWGQTNNVARWDFPITFPNAVIGVYAGINYNGEQSGYNAVKTLTTSYLEPTLQSPLVTTYWRVLGY